tara:strand:- start:1929 stop:2219 length:291 start_codon:yes stop_codon:yes gene_type:complete
MGCILCCFTKKYNQINTNLDTNSNINLNTHNKIYKRPGYKNNNNNKSLNNTIILTDSQIRSYDNILLNNKNDKKRKADIYRKWRENYLDNSGKLYI